MAKDEAADSPAADSPAAAGVCRLGLPFWGLGEWTGNFYPSRARAADFLSHYASVFSTVEGNTTFYSLPSTSTVEKWRRATPESFRFCFKLPRAVTHERALLGAEAEAAAFFDRLAPLGPRLGPFLIQLPPSFGAERLPVLDRFLAALPEIAGPVHRFAVELRQAVFYLPPLAGELDSLLVEHGADRCLIDTRALRDGDASHPEVTAARHRKPDLPVEPRAVGRRPMLRLVGHPDFAVSEPWLRFWAEHIATWLAEGRCPHVFIHLPDNLRAPRLARRFHDELRRRWPIDPLPPFPADAEPSQLSLFR